MLAGRHPGYQPDAQLLPLALHRWIIDLPPTAAVAPCIATAGHQSHTTSCCTAPDQTALSSPPQVSTASIWLPGRRALHPPLAAVAWGCVITAHASRLASRGRARTTASTSRTERDTSGRESKLRQLCSAIGREGRTRTAKRSRGMLKADGRRRVPSASAAPAAAGARVTGSPCAAARAAAGARLSLARVR